MGLDGLLPSSQAVHCKEKAFTYNECIACCPASCQSQASCVDSEIACVDGCYCPDGMPRVERVPGSIFLGWHARAQSRGSEDACLWDE